MKNRSIVALKVLVHAACLAPVAWLLYHLLINQLGPDPTAKVTFFTGRGTLRLLVLSLAITPVRKLAPKLGWLVRFRRMIGLYAFFYACLHLLTYVGLYAGFSVQAMLDDITERRYIMVGFASWLMLVPLALTSTAWSIRKLGGKRWQQLHRLAYLAAVGGVIHYWWIVKPGVHTPWTITVILAILLAARPALSYLSERRRQRLRPA